MTDSDFTRLLSQAVKTAKKHRGLMLRINKECILRYGRPYGDLTLSETIELDNSVGSDMLTAKRFDLLVKESFAEAH
ncbi:MAG: hypothetical protein KUG78_13115 [Kangiellaceae bacterium]|nr:hypothetical protein [Kangiellaceae bacterium]